MTLKIEDLKVGDKVLDNDGDIQTVLATFVTKKKQQVVVEFEDSILRVHVRDQKAFDTFKSEVVLPEQFAWVNIYTGNSGYAHSSLKSAKASSDGAANLVSRQKIKVEPGRFDD